MTYSSTNCVTLYVLGLAPLRGKRFASLPISIASRTILAFLIAAEENALTIDFASRKAVVKLFCPRFRPHITRVSVHEC